MTKETILRISGVDPRKCMRCGKCSGTCPSYDEMEYHPHQFVYMVEKGEIEPLDEIQIHLSNAFPALPAWSAARGVWSRPSWWRRSAWRSSASRAKTI